jgi:hypothetical protein
MGQHETCNCHECTQARWKMSLQGQIEMAMRQVPMTDPDSLAQPSPLRYVPTVTIGGTCPSQEP